MSADTPGVLTEQERAQFVANLRQNLGYAIAPVIADTLCSHVEEILAARVAAERERADAPDVLTEQGLMEALEHAVVVLESGSPDPSVEDYARAAHRVAVEYAAARVAAERDQRIAAEAKVAAVEARADEWDRLARQHRAAAMRDGDIERDWIATDYASKASELRAALGGEATP